MNPNMQLDVVIAQKLGELTILNAKQAVLIDTLKMELAKAKQEIATLRGREPELPLDAKKEKGNGAIAH
jgi:restriction endonuclease S subunit